MLLVGLVAANAQPRTEAPTNAEMDRSMRVKMALIARGGPDSIVLRWAPAKPAVWLIGSKVGYRLERANMGTDGRAGAFRALVDTAIKPWGIERWHAYAQANPIVEGSDIPNYPAIAFNLLDQFGTDGPVRDNYSTDELTSIAERKAELEMRFGFAMIAVDRSVAAAEGLGLRFADRTVVRGERYVYRVYLAGSAGEYTIDTGVVSVTAKSDVGRVDGVERSTDGVVLTNSLEKQILIRWRANSYFGSYFVDRSDDNGSTFKRMNRIPFVTLRHDSTTPGDEELFLDSNTINYKEYRYRVYGTTAFGDEELVNEAPGMSRDLTPPTKPFLPNPNHVSAREVRVAWVMSDPTTPDLAGFRVARGSSDSGVFTYITKRLSPSTREVVDTSFDDGGTNYYVVEAVDTARNSIRSNTAYVTLIDSVPPGIPVWIDGKMDSLGVVTLRLKARTEQDLMGYRILRANAADHEFSVLLESFNDNNTYNANDSVYRDTVEIQTLTRNVYYRVTALDKNHNESPMSVILVVPRPDVIAPVAPVIRDVRMTDTTVILGYVSSTSEDIAWHIVYRRVSEGAAWDSIARVGPRDTLYTDNNVSKSVDYWYAMRAVDSSGLRSDLSPSVVGRAYETDTRPEVQNLTARYNPTRRVVELAWQYPTLAEEFWFVVYGTGAGGQLQKFARVSSTDRTFTDDAPLQREDGTAQYAVRVVARSGSESKLEPRVQVAIGR